MSLAFGNDNSKIVEYQISVLLNIHHDQIDVIDQKTSQKVANNVYLQKKYLRNGNCVAF